MPGPTEMKYSTTSILRIPRSAKYGFSGLETRTSWPSTSRTTASLLLPIQPLRSARGRRVSRRAGQPVYRRGGGGGGGGGPPGGEGGVLVGGGGPAPPAPEGAGRQIPGPVL